MYQRKLPHTDYLFLHNLKLARLITQHTIVGADRNTVADLSLDVRYKQGVTTEYSNGHAAMWDRMMAGVGLRDVFRELEGPRAKQYTRLGSSVHTGSTVCSAHANRRSSNGTPLNLPDYPTPHGLLTT